MRSIIAIAGIAFLTSGCQLLGFEGVDDNDDHRERWAEHHDGSYSYRLMRGCFCPLGGEFRVQVVDFAVVDVTDLLRDDPVDSTRFDEIETVEDLFDLIDRARAEHADELHVEYAPEGYPSAVNIDWYKQAVDDEMFMGVSEVTVGVQNAD